MSEMTFGHCVVVPCCSEQSWVVPQQCLGEIVTISAGEEQPPQEISWRGEVVPVVDFGSKDSLPWRDQRGGAGLVAVVLGQRGEACQYFGVAVRGAGLGVSHLMEDEMEDLPETVLDYATAAFRMNGVIYHVPDLLALQRAVGAGKVTIQ
jgi:hypothetical protein